MKNYLHPYPHPKPSSPPQIYLLITLTIAGLIALWLAAFSAFQNVGGIWQAAFAATLIEAGLVVEALTLIRYRTWYAALGLTISIVVSGTYNLVQAQQAAGQSLNFWPLLTLALGPLSALVFVSLALGQAVSQHQTEAEAWAEARAQWLTTQANEQQAYDRKQAELTRRRKERKEKLSGNLPKITGKSGKSGKENGKLPEDIPVKPESLNHFRQLVSDGIIRPETLTGPTLAAITGTTPRTARNWIASVRNGNGNGTKI